MADLREQLLAAFAVEYREHLDVMRAALKRTRGGEPLDAKEVFRRAHSLKGAARAVELPAVEELAHGLESLFSEALQNDSALPAEAIDEALRRLDDIEAAASPAPQAAAPETEDQDAVIDEAAPEFLRVDAGQMRALGAAMHELSAELDAMDPVALRDALAHLRAMASTLDAAAVEAQRAPAQAASRVAGAAKEMRAMLREVAEQAQRDETERWRVQQAASRLREQVSRVAMIPASAVFAGLDAMVREMGRQAGLDVEFAAEGMDTQAERRLMQTLRDPVIQLLRNAIAHGAESASARREAGKPERMTVGVAISSSGGRLILAVFDDGRGPDLARIEQVGRERGLIDTVFSPPPETLLSLVFEPGFSTAGDVGRMAGRGVGLSVVSEAVRAAGGSVFMRQRRPYGAEICISAPLSAARQTLVLIREGGNVYGLPSYAVERVMEVPADGLETLDGRSIVRLEREGNQVLVPVVALGNVTGAAAGVDAGRNLTIAVLRQGDLRLGLAADAAEDVRAATLAPLESPDVSDLVAGAAQLEGGEVAVVLKPDVIFQRHLRGQLGSGLSLQAPSQAKRRMPTILVVDDSVTTRTLEKSILEAQGYRVVLSVDGLDALSALRNPSHLIDLVVADIEMPRMDGFQLLQALKADAELAAKPVILMTSRADPEDVRRGMELGADAYLVKQSFDQRELLAAIGQLL
jgi:two-component system, chemotaxis family, sensor kinase CheA